MPKANPNPAHKPEGSSNVELSDRYRSIGSAAILAALVCKMKQGQAQADEKAKRKRQAA